MGRWMSIRIRLRSTYIEIVKMKQMLKPYADELGWVMAETEEAGTHIANILIMPEGGHIRPAEFLAKKDKILGVAFAIWRDVIFEGKNEGAIKNLQELKRVEALERKEKKTDEDDVVFFPPLVPWN